MADNTSTNVRPLHYAALVKGQNKIPMEIANSKQPKSTPIYAVINLTDKYTRRRERLMMEEQKSSVIESDDAEVQPADYDNIEPLRWNADTAGVYEEIVEFRSTIVTEECRWDSDDDGQSSDEHIYEPINVRSECRLPAQKASSSSANSAPSTSTQKRSRFVGYFKRNKMMDTLCKMCDSSRVVVIATAPKDAGPLPQQQATPSTCRLVTQFRKMWPNNQSRSRRSFKESLTRICRMRIGPDDDAASGSTAPSIISSMIDAEPRKPMLPPLTSAALEHILAARTKFLQSCLNEATNKMDQPRSA